MQTRVVQPCAQAPLIGDCLVQRQTYRERHIVVNTLLNVLLRISDCIALSNTFQRKVFFGGIDFSLFIDEIEIICPIVKINGLWILGLTINRCQRRNPGNSGRVRLIESVG